VTAVLSQGFDAHSAFTERRYRTFAEISNAIEIRNLVKNYPAFTLGPVDLSVPRGAIQLR
jgi:hypothetical protein